MSSDLHPLRAGSTLEDGATSPEALLISALLESGQFTPEIHHVVDDDIEAWRKLWDFCVEYQQRAGCAPPPALVKARFSEFDPVANVSLAWAASKAREAAAARNLRTRSKAMLSALAEDDLEGAFGAMENLQRPRGHRKDPANIFDHSVLEETFEVSRIEVPYRTLSIALKGGFGPGELIYLAARLGQGKSWELAGYAAKAAKCGVSVGYASLEMPCASVTLRILMRMLDARKDKELNALLCSGDAHKVKEATDVIAERTPGRIEVVDPSHGRINTTTAIHEMAREYDQVIIDHVGLLMTADGRRAIDDWRAMALISNTLREITLATGTPILAAAQVNREGERTGGHHPPKVSQLSQSDALGQDADVVITMNRLSERVMVHSAAKVREGPNLKWYTRFDPAKNLFHEITKDQAMDLALSDEDNNAD